MSSFRNPVGSQPPEVYWRRRLIVGLGALIVIVVILLIVFAPKGGSTPTAGGSDTPRPTDGSAASTPPTVACDPANLTVTAATDKPSYATGEVPQLSFTVKNTGATACVLNAGTDQQDFLITSGKQKEKYWDSKDCQSDSTPAQVPLDAGGEISSGVPLEWNRTRSSTSTCTTGGAAVPAGATYQLTVTVSGVSSDPVNIVLAS